MSIGPRSPTGQRASSGTSKENSTPLPALLSAMARRGRSGHGLCYIPAGKVAALPPCALVDRIQVLGNPVEATDYKIAAMLGAVPVPQLMLSGLRVEHMGR
jgi:hypothetical protein